MRGLQQIKKLWFSEDSRLSLRAKQAVAALLPRQALVALKKRYYLRLLRNPRGPAEADAEGVKLLVQPGDFVVDIGAFVGFYSQLLSNLVGPSGEVWSFEPIPETFEILTFNMRELKLSNVRLFHCAISDACGSARMEIPRYKGGGESLYDARISKTTSQLRSVDVDLRSLDSVLTGVYRRLAFIKCDAEFHELQCIRGAVQTIRRWRPALMVELLGYPDQEGTAEYATLQLLRSEGYVPYLYDGIGFQERRQGQKSQNVFFLSEAHVARLRH